MISYETETLLNFMKKMILVFVVSFGMSSISFAAQDHNSSRSNKSGLAAEDLGGETEDFSKFIGVADSSDYTSGALLQSADLMEAKAKNIRDFMLIGTFANHLVSSVEGLRCSGKTKLEFSRCLSQAIIKAESATLGE